MNIEKDLKKDGITVIKPVDTLSVTLIAKYVAEKLISALPFCGLNYNNLFIKISNTPMFIADIPNSMGEASYFYKNSSIYFKNGLSIHEMKRYAVHEFIHAYQEIKDKNNLLHRLGLCDFTNIKVHGMALNEAAVQLISAKALNNDIENVKYYDIEFSTNTPTLYPIICNLVKQLAYITGENVLIDSTLNSNTKFAKSIIALCGEKNFYKIESNLDKILKIEEKMISLSNKIQNEFLSETFIARAASKIGIYKASIKNIFFETQNLIITSYFNNALNNVYSLQEIEDYRKKLYHYRDLLGVTENYNFFNDYYINMMIKLDERYEALSNVELSLVPYTRSIFEIILQKIHALISNKRTRNKLSEIKINLYFRDGAKTIKLYFRDGAKTIKL